MEGWGAVAGYKEGVWSEQISLLFVAEKFMNAVVQPLKSNSQMHPTSLFCSCLPCNLKGMHQCLCSEDVPVLWTG
jgi:hypothetical protein